MLVKTNLIGGIKITKDWNSSSDIDDREYVIVLMKNDRYSYGLARYIKENTKDVLQNFGVCNELLNDDNTYDNSIKYQSCLTGKLFTWKQYSYVESMIKKLILEYEEELK